MDEKAIVDLTHTFAGDMPVYPGDVVPALQRSASAAADGYTDYRLTSGMHVGTHIDGPLHMIESGAFLSDVAASRFVGRGVVLNAAHDAPVDIDLLQGIVLQHGDIVLVNTGWHHNYHRPDYYLAYPEITSALAEALLRAEVSIVGLDTPSPDRPPYPIHKTLLGAGILIIENLTNLDALRGASELEVLAFPMKLQADSAPARVVARVPA